MVEREVQLTTVEREVVQSTKVELEATEAELEAVAVSMADGSTEQAAERAAAAAELVGL